MTAGLGVPALLTAADTHPSPGRHQLQATARSLAPDAAQQHRPVDAGSNQGVNEAVDHGRHVGVAAAQRVGMGTKVGGQLSAGLAGLGRGGHEISDP
ncbi:MAG: hypothetical protein M3083_18260 [Actinomycetota bacterium]|nr:hypothetical protein [Actinomycetota bacterium]MDQ6947000.1 hypothetical protein [Actinomycetota bacterium]